VQCKKNFFLCIAFFNLEMLINFNESCKNIFNIFSYFYIHNLNEYQRVSTVNIVGSNRVIETKRGYNIGETLGKKHEPTITNRLSIEVNFITAQL